MHNALRSLIAGTVLTACVGTASLFTASGVRAEVRSPEACYKAKDLACLKELQPRLTMDGADPPPGAYNASYYAALHLLEEVGTPQAIAEAKSQLEVAVTFGNGHQQALAKLQELYTTGAAEFSASECLMIKSEACMIDLADKKNDPPAQYLLGSKLLNEDKVQGVAYLQRAADQGHKTAACILAKGKFEGVLATKMNYSEATNTLIHNCFGESPYKNLDKKHVAKFNKQELHKAYAFSESGTSHFKYNFLNAEVAAWATLATCNKRNKQKDQPCQIVNIDGTWVKPGTPVVKPETVRGIESLLTRRALESYQQKYLKSAGQRVFVQSLTGSWSWQASPKDSLQRLTQKALANCQSRNRNFRDEYPCRVINVNGEWQ